MSTELSSLVSLEWLKACPIGILVLNKGQAPWGNPALERMLGQTPARLSPETLQTLVGADSPVTINPGTAEECRVRCHRADLPGAPGDGLDLYFLQDLSRESTLAWERDVLARKVEELTLTDTLTGLPNRRALGNVISAQVTRSRRYDNPLALALIQPVVDGLSPPGDAVMITVSRFLRDRLRWADVIGREDGDTFMVILPETDAAAALGLLREIQDEVTHLRLAPPEASSGLRLNVGLAQWRKGLDGAHLVSEARRQLEPG